MADKQYDLPEKVVKLFYEKQKMKQKSKAYFERFVTNPHRPMGDGPPFDPQLFRLSAAHRYIVDHYRPTAKNIPLLFIYYVIPISVVCGYIHYTATTKEKLIRSGVVAYKDRTDKFIY